MFDNVVIQSKIKIVAGDGDITVCHCNLDVAGGKEAKLKVEGGRMLTVLGDLNGRNNASNNKKVKLELKDDGSAIAVAGDMVWSSGNTDGADNIEMKVKDNTSLTCSGNLSITNTDGGKAIIKTENESTWTTQGNATFIQTGGKNLVFAQKNTSGSEHFKVVGDVFFDHDGGEDIWFDMEGVAEFAVGGNMSIDWDGADADNADVYVDMVGSNLLDIEGSLDINMNETARNDCDIRIFNDNSSGIYVGVAGTTTESATFTIQDGDAFTIDLDDDGVMEIYGDLSIQTDGDGDLRILLSNTAMSAAANAQLKVDGNMTINKTDGDAFNMKAEKSADFDIAGDFIYSGSNHDAGVGNNEIIELFDDAVMDVDGNFSMTMEDVNQENDMRIALFADAILYAGTNATDEFDFIFVDGKKSRFRLANSAKAYIAGDFNFVSTNQSSEECWIRINITQGDDAELHIGGDLDIDNLHNAIEMEVRIGGNNSLLNVDGNIDISSATAANRIELNLFDKAKIELGGNFIRGAVPNDFGGLVCADDATVEYNGVSTSQIFARDQGAGSDGFTYQNVIINNTSGISPEFTMTGNATVNGTLTLTNGVIFTDNGDTVVVAGTSGADITGHSGSSFINGNLRRYFTTNTETYPFPVGNGNTASDYHLFEIENQAMNGGGFTYVDGYFGALATGGVLSLTEEGTPYGSIAPEGVWFLTPDNQPSSGKMSAKPHISNFSGLVDNEFAQLHREISSSDAADWTCVPCNFSVAPNDGINANNGIGRIVGGGFAYRRGVNSFGQFGIGISSSGALPVELASFEAHLNKDQVDLKWVTLSESNNSHFTVERSLDGLKFEEVLQVEGNNESSFRIEYFDVDYNPLEGVSYYRLKQTDFDGKYSYSGIVPVEYIKEGDSGLALFDGESAEISLWPNPSDGKEINIELAGYTPEQEVLVVLRDVEGKEFFSKVLITDINGHLIDAIDPSNNLASGTYLITGSDKNHLYSKVMIIRK